MRVLYWYVLIGLGLASLGFIASGTQPAEVTGQGVMPQVVNANPPAEPVKLIFIHHSCGENWLSDDHGGLGLALRDNNYFVSDTNYGWGPEGIGDRTDIGHWWDWFRGPQHDTYLTALYTESDRFGDYYSRLGTDPGGENEIVVFKSCFPNSYLEGGPHDPPTTDDNPLRGQESWSEVHSVANAKGIYNYLLEYFATRQDKLFIAVTAPPLMVGETDEVHAANARAFNNWLVNDWLAEYPYPNVAVFDFYNVLTSNGGDFYAHDAGQDSGNHHRIWNGAVQHIQTVDNNMSAYPDGDSHPTPAGNQKATAEFAPLLNYYYNRWKSVEAPPVAPTAAADQVVEPSPTPAEEAETEVEPTSAPEADTAQPDEAQPLIEGVIESFDAAPEYWEADSDGEGSRVDFWLDDEMMYSGAGSGCVEYTIAPDGWVYFGRSFEPVQDWSNGNGLSVWLHATEAGQWATLMLFAGDPEAATPFEAYFEISAESSEGWAQYVFPWLAFERAAWADEGGLGELDPGQVVGLGFSLGAEGEPVEGTLWVDEISLVTNEIQPLPPEEEEISLPESTSEPTPPPAEPAEPAQPTEAAGVAEPTTPSEPPEVPAEAVEPPTEEEAGGGLCPLATIMLPLVLATVVLGRRVR